MLEFKKIKNLKLNLRFFVAERVGFEPTVGYKPTPIFKTGAINQLDHLSVWNSIILAQFIIKSQAKNKKKINFFT